MRILLDENAPSGLRRVLAGHDVRTAPEMGWAHYSNGQLLDEAENAGFEALITGKSKLAVSAESYRPKYRRHHFLHQCLAHHSHPPADGAARGRECLTGHFHLCHFSSSVTIPAPACTHLLLVQIIHLVPGSERGSTTLSGYSAFAAGMALRAPEQPFTSSREDPLNGVRRGRSCVFR